MHTVGSNNPDGIEIKKNKDENGIPKDGIPFHPYYTVKDLFVLCVFLIIFALIMFYWPDFGGYFLEAPNFEPADPMRTPEHIAPVWYFTPFYSILRAVPDKLGGVIAMGGSIVVLFILPWLDRGEVKSIRYRSGIFKFALVLFVISFIALGILGTRPATPTATIFARLFSAIYFLFFLSLPFYSTKEKTKPLPERLTHSVIPLEERVGWHWDLVRRILAWVTSIEAYRRLTGVVGGYLKKADGYVEELIKKYSK